MLVALPLAKHVSSRANDSRSAKTQTQCKNKMESMKKRYRSESAAGTGVSPWPLYHRLHLLLRGGGNINNFNGLSPPPLPPPVLADNPMPPPPPPPPLGCSNGVDRMAKLGDHGSNSGINLSDQESDRNQANDIDSSTPHVAYTRKEKSKMKAVNGEKINNNATKRRRKDDNWDIGESIRRLADVVLRSEQARMDMMLEIEKMRVEAEERRSQVDLRRTEIITNTQLEIAKLFAEGFLDSSLRIKRS